MAALIIMAVASVIGITSLGIALVIAIKGYMELSKE